MSLWEKWKKSREKVGDKGVNTPFLTSPDFEGTLVLKVCSVRAKKSEAKENAMGDPVIYHVANMEVMSHVPSGSAKSVPEGTKVSFVKGDDTVYNVRDIGNFTAALCQMHPNALDSADGAALMEELWAGGEGNGTEFKDQRLIVAEVKPRTSKKNSTFHNATFYPCDDNGERLALHELQDL